MQWHAYNGFGARVSNPRGRQNGKTFLSFCFLGFMGVLAGLLSTPDFETIERSSRYVMRWLRGRKEEREEIRTALI